MLSTTIRFHLVTLQWTGVCTQCVTFVELQKGVVRLLALQQCRIFGDKLAELVGFNLIITILDNHQIKHSTQLSLFIIYSVIMKINLAHHDCCNCC